MFLLYPNTEQIIINVPEGITAVPINSSFKSVWTYNYPLIGICKHIEREEKGVKIRKMFCKKGSI